MSLKRIKDLEPADVKKYCSNKIGNIRKGYCAGCPFRIDKAICLTTLFMINGSMNYDITTRNELRLLRQFKEQFKEILDQEIEVEE